MPTRLIDSTPPPIANSCWPAMICAEAKLTASKPRGAEAIDLHAGDAVAEAGD